ncbi:MAG TPA: tripartite tricarboxylate transporter substrate binding protein [Usitatibacter sp.]|nr:tripartite tricarboxylate transporter substrate binding protein [Usitatibacter sp.]
MLQRWLVVLVLLFSPAALAQGAWPVKPVRMIVPFAPGGASDFVARMLAPKLGEALGQQVVVENKAGASGNIGMEFAAKSAPDGYTVYLGNIGTIAINPAVFQGLAIDPQRDFIAVTLVAETPSILVTHPSVAAATAAELVKLAKARPGELNYGSPGSSTLNRLEMERFMHANGIRIVHVPYKGGAGPAVTGLIGGDTQVMFITLSSALGFVNAGRLKALGITTVKRIDALPQVPTMAEQGFGDMVSSSWQGVFVPAGTPRAIVDKLHAALLDVLSAPDLQKRFEAGGAYVVTSRTPDEFAAYVAAEGQRWGRIAKESGATID